MLTSRQRRARKRFASKVRRLPYDAPVPWSVWEALRKEREQKEGPEA